MSFLVLMLAIFFAVVLQVVLGYEFATSYLLHKTRWPLRLAIHAGLLAIACAIGWFAGTGETGHQHAVEIIIFFGIAGFLASLYWYVKYPVPPRRSGRIVMFSAPFPTPPEMIRLEPAIGRTQPDLFTGLGHLVDERI